MAQRPLPPGLQTILPALAADAGRSRAATLMAILGAGPDYVAEHVAAIDAALGTSSPGITRLTDLVNETRAAASVAAPTVPRQHVISRAILRRFTVNQPPGGTQLTRHDVLNGKEKDTGPGGVGYVENFVKIDSAATELVWKQVEDKLTAAITAAEAGTVLGDPALVTTLRNAIALHYVRSPQTLDVHEAAFAKTYADGLERWAGTPLSEEAFRRRYGGLVPAGREGRLLGAKELLGRISDRFNEGVIFRLRVQDLFEAICGRFANHGLEIVSPASPDKEFLLGDIPALSLNFASGAAGVAEGVGLDNANTLVLPLAPRTLAALGPADAIGTAADALVDSLNALQIRTTRRNAVYRPGSALGAFVMATRPPMVTTA